MPHESSLTLRPARLSRGLRTALLAAFLGLGALEGVALYHLWPSDDGLTYETQVTVVPAFDRPATATGVLPAEQYLPGPLLLSGLGLGMIGLGLYRRRRAA